MKKIKTALINNINYCKFPEGINDIKKFIEFLNKNFNSFFELEIFVEEGCVAPYFIEEELKTEIQYWNPSNIRLIKEDEIFILPKSEYQKKLKKVISEKCVNCVNYSEDVCDDDCKSFVDHIDLNGNCYAFEKKL